MRIHGISITFLRDENDFLLFHLRLPISRRCSTRPLPLNTRNHHIRIPTQSIARIDRIGIRLNTRIIIRALDISFALQVFSGRMSGLKGWPSDDGAIAVLSSFFRCLAVVRFSVFGAESFFTLVPVATFVCTNIFRLVVLDHDLFLELFVDSALF